MRYFQVEKEIMSGKKGDTMTNYENTATEIDKMTIKEWLHKLTDENWHNERMIVEAIIDGRDDLIDRACIVRLRHSLDGHLTENNGQERDNIYKEMERE